MLKNKYPIAIVFVILFLDQLLKIWVKTSMALYQKIYVFGDWFIIHFIENNGMAFGLEIGGETGKMILSIFRILAVIAISWYIYKLMKEKVHTGLVISMSMILAGAFGNIIDSAIYGIIFNESGYSQVAELFPEAGGYAGFLHGKVVDMLHFPVLTGHFPSWFPIWSGKYFEFFRPVFNIADSSITIGVAIILIFQKKFFKSHKKNEEVAEDIDHSEETKENMVQNEHA